MYKLYLITKRMESKIPKNITWFMDGPYFDLDNVGFFLNSKNEFCYYGEPEFSVQNIL